MRCKVSTSTLVRDKTPYLGFRGIALSLFGLWIALFGVAKIITGYSDIFRTPVSIYYCIALLELSIGICLLLRKFAMHALYAVVAICLVGVMLSLLHDGDCG